MANPSVLALLASSALLLAGCTGGTDEATGDAGPDGQGPDGQGSGPIALGPPVWQVGQSWAQDWALSDGDTFTVTSVVAETTPAGYVVAATDRGAAAIHGAFTLPTLGTFARDSLTATADGGTWPWYKFPLTENLTWQASLSSKDGEGGTYQQSWTMTARNVTARTADIEAKIGDATVARYDFDNSTGWFTEARFYSEDGVLQLQATVTAAATGYTGALYDATGGDFLFEQEFGAEPAAASVEGEPAGSFAPASDHTHLLAFGYAYAVGGAAATALVAPDGTAYPLVTDPMQAAAGSGSFGMLVVPAVQGEWALATAGAGAFAWGGGGLAYGITMRDLMV